MTSQYIDACYARALASAEQLREVGQEAGAIEISSDVLAMIQMGGINFIDRPVFAGFPIVERTDTTDHIQAIVCDRA